LIQIHLPGQYFNWFHYVILLHINDW
jgi:hypothetical protein